MKPQLYILLLATILIGCEVSQKDIKPEDHIIKIYNDQDISLSYYPVSIVQTNDGGFLILNGVKTDSALSEYPTATIYKTNSIGEIEWTTETAWQAPASIVKLGGKYSFVAKDGENSTNLINIDISSGQIGGNTELGIRQMPLAVYSKGADQFVVLAYKYDDWTSYVALYNKEGVLINSTDLNVNADEVALIQGHLNKTNDELPFFIGEWDNGTQAGYFVNCLSNYSLRAVFFDLNLSLTGGNIYSFQARDALSSLVNKEGNTFAMTRYYSGNNYISTNIEVDPNSSQNFNGFVQNQLYELVPEAKVVSRNITKGASDYIMLASTTNSNSVALYQYSTVAGEGDDEALHTEYIKFSNNIEVRDVIQDENDEGIVVLGQLYFTGKYKRPVLIKIPIEKFSE